MATRKKSTVPAAAPGGRQRLAAAEITARLARLPGWRATGGGSAIARTYELPSFRAALAFVSFVGEIAEAKNHHPDIDVRYNKVTLTLSTHDAGGVTASDFELARMVDPSGAAG
jgi:4a-hydroxytetrahydrobiopterin dehydratase